MPRNSFLAYRMTSLTLRSSARFGFASHDAGERVRGLQLAGWQGQAAQMFKAQAARIPIDLAAAAEDFLRAARAVDVYAATLAEGQNQASFALALWRDADARSKVWRGVIPGATSDSAADPGAADMARAVALVNTARAAVADSAAELSAVLDAASEGAPRDPGLFARIGAAIRSFSVGLARTLGAWARALSA
jgi:hypothetical protein